MKPSPLSHSQDPPVAIEPLTGKDEMNLAEFPLVKLGKRDRRKVITFERHVNPREGTSYFQKWEVHGSAGLGLPDETGDRVIVALMKLTAEQGFHSPKVTFSPYRILQMLGWRTEGKKTYAALEKILKQLVAITVYSERAFYDNSKKKRVTTHKAFHIIEEIWLRKWEDDDEKKNEETHQAYIIWGDTFWKSLESGYIKNLNLRFYYSLENAIARRLYRFLDKWLYQRNDWEFDIYDVAGRLGMVRYDYPSEVKKAMKPACEELKERGFLEDYEFHKKGKYTRVKFVKATAASLAWKEMAESLPFETAEDTESGNTSPSDGRELAQTGESIPEDLTAPNDPWSALYQAYGTSEEHQAIWVTVLKNLSASMPKSTYEGYIAHTQLLAIESNKAVVGVLHAQSKDWLENRMGNKILKTLNGQLEEKVKSLQFVGLHDLDKATED